MLFPFLSLPLELREQIYSLYFNPSSRLERRENGGGQYRFDFDILRVSKQVYIEAQTVWRREVHFVRIETPWPQAAWIHAVNHISHEGLVPIVTAGVSGDTFRYHHGLVQITAPAYGGEPEHTIVVLLDDLHLFCYVWFYSALNYEELNHHLRVSFALQDPYYPADPKPIPIALQKKLLLPFGKVKELDEVTITGYDDVVKEELEREMATPYDSPQKCCEDSAEFMEAGDRVLSEGRPKGALELYFKAFHAIHIIISGRLRSVLADHFFHKSILEGRYKGQTGTTVRIILRIMLVSRTVNAYLKLEQWEEAAFWGIRSIKIMRNTVGTEFEDFLVEVAGMLDSGLLYLRTGIAMKKMEENGSEELSSYTEDEGVGSSESLFRVVGKFLVKHHRGLIHKELEENSVKVPESVFLFDLPRDDRSDVDSMAPMSHVDAEAEAEDSTGTSSTQAE
ncbi:hypothetical protein CC78DRAFT_617989 [Lojkania enalia]|uniref:Uncharacterized protein n=1 Tax=Lojkania enalia TaxID=147567 RepID=A0A9P4N7V4_9PLEO|nr:hypothetical protein CC78DRAFT_617989 [Didymosphaeria enalia]